MPSPPAGYLPHDHARAGLGLLRFWSSACPRFPLKTRCTPSDYRRITRWEHEAIIDAMQRRLDRQPNAGGRTPPGWGMKGVQSSSLWPLVSLLLRTSTPRCRARPLFWAAFIHTRPLGETIGDLLDKPHSHGGLELIRYTASASLGRCPRRNPTTASPTACI